MFARVFILFLLLNFQGLVYGQVFTSITPSSIPLTYANLTSTAIAVSGLPTSLDGITIGLTQVEVTITANVFTNIELFLISPDNRMVRLFSRLSGATTVNGTFTFNMSPGNPQIRNWTSVNPPPAAPFLPDVSLNSVNDGSNPNGTWKLFGRGTGNTVTSFKLTFGTSNISPTIPNDDCSGATTLINTRTAGGFISGTNIGTGANLPNVDKGSYVCSSSPYSENTAWYTWIASCSDDSIVIMTNGGVQTGIVKGTCATSMTLVQCNGQYVTYHTYKSLGLTPGTKYYLVFDGDEALGVTYEIRYYPGGCSLPVNLLYIQAEYNSSTSLINVVWQTSMENNNKGFHIETRLVSGEGDFTEIGFIPAENNPSGAEYSFSFNPEFAGLYEVRLVQEDMDGNKTFSASAFVSTEQESESLEIYYTNDHSPLANFYLSEPEKIYYDLINTNGVKLFSSSVAGTTGYNSLDISAPLPSGVYILHAHANKKASTKKIAIIK